MSADGLDLDALAELDQAATDRPWEASDIYGLVRPSQIDGWTQYLERTAADNQRHADIHLIAQACNALPALIAAVRERDALVDGRIVVHVTEIKLRGDDQWSLCDVGVYPVTESRASTVASLAERLDTELDRQGEIDRNRWVTRTLGGELREVRVEHNHHEGESHFRHTIKAADNTWLDRTTGTDDRSTR